MARLLYIESSPRKERSASTSVARAFTEEYGSTHQGDTVDTLDLWNTALPEFAGDIINAKYALLHGETLTGDLKNAWAAVEQVIADFMKADKYLISLPMWNFSVPYKLKQYIDILVQPGYTFSYSPERGYEGLVTGKPLAVIYARGGSYPEETDSADFDFQKRYMELIFGFMGFADLQSIVVEPTLSVTHEERNAIIRSAQAQARAIAAGF